MARITEARLTATGTGRDAVLQVDMELDWDRADRDRRFEVTVRLVGDDAGISGRDDPLLIRSVSASPDTGDAVQIRVSNDDGVLDEDRGDDEIFAECELREIRPDTEVVRTNTVKGSFS